MKQLPTTRAGTVNVEKCVEVCGNRFDLIIISTIRTNELRKQHRHSPDKYISAIDALLEIQEGKLDPVKYLKRVK